MIVCSVYYISVDSMREQVRHILHLIMQIDQEGEERQHPSAGRIPVGSSADACNVLHQPQHPLVVLLMVWMDSHVRHLFHWIHTFPWDGTGVKPSRGMKKPHMHCRFQRRSTLVQTLEESGRVSRERHVADETRKEGKECEGWKEEEFPMCERDTRRTWKTCVLRVLQSL